MSTPALEGFVPVDAASLREAERAADEVRRARTELERATRTLVELAEDMKIDAVRRLRERGASAAQVERYEAAYRAAAEEARAGDAALADACRAMHEAVLALSR